MQSFSANKVSQQDITDAKAAYRDRQPAPLDGMWQAFVDMGQAWQIIFDDEAIGHGVLNEDGHILQFDCNQSANVHEAFSAFCRQSRAAGAIFADFEEPLYTLAAEHGNGPSVAAILYQLPSTTNPQAATFPKGSCLIPLRAEQLGDAVAFANETLGADKDWLTAYYGDLIAKEELFGLLNESGALIAVGERRVSVCSKGYADVGMIVGKDARGKGIATNILRALVSLCREDGLRAICSTESDNIGAQKAVSRAGFKSSHKMLGYTF